MGSDDFSLICKRTVDLSQDAIVSAGGNGIIILWNPAAVRMFGYTEDEAVGMSIEAIVPEDYRERHKRGFSEFLVKGDGPLIGAVTELEGLKKNGSKFPLELSLGAERTGGGWIFTAVIRDITGRKLLETENMMRLTELERFSRVTAGRELKMEELRKEIRELRARLAEGQVNGSSAKNG